MLSMPSRSSARAGRDGLVSVDIAEPVVEDLGVVGFLDGRLFEPDTGGAHAFHGLASERHPVELVRRVQRDRGDADAVEHAIRHAVLLGAGATGIPIAETAQLVHILQGNQRAPAEIDRVGARRVVREAQWFGDVVHAGRERHALGVRVDDRLDQVRHVVVRVRRHAVPPLGEQGDGRVGRGSRV
jgi:hypothetical protein